MFQYVPRRHVSNTAIIKTFAWGRRVLRPVAVLVICSHLFLRTPPKLDWNSAHRYFVVRFNTDKPPSVGTDFPSFFEPIER